MVAPTFDVRETSRATTARAIRADGECLRYRLEVVAASAADVVESAGGWLYDRVMAGWEVTALLPHGGDTRPLRILGIAVADLPSRIGEEDPARHSLAVSAEAFAADAGVRRRVLTSLDARTTEVALWGHAGQGWPLGVHRVTAKAQHVLSAAARTYKGYALAAAGISCGAVNPIETLLCDMTTHSPAGAQLIQLD
ncbi:hypothetical protein MSAS_37170 [Mycobacterium saskatchewanense]|uniref:Uncharacterized protein n=1 Tax=Mycobacterium saskatchewanense TaxID=220927 RepID=A0AAJ3NTM6_9MYCO|nr:hypothetical protein [Mycobacterium saskatchewanense]ORW73860.1 hypothetical protein AWC23_00685 [Mycobacterium saskatchewanense]BBX64543.1 hypothetical protein MSAS_37170 [Mycobacterium saskatchewanense]